MKNLFSACGGYAMKKRLSVAPLSASAETDGEYTYSVLDDGTAMITAYTGYDSYIFIPSNIGGYSVSTIGSSVFLSSDIVISVVVIPDTVTCIRGNAFRNCTNLTEAVIGSSLIKISECMFADCPCLSKVTLSDPCALTEIDDFAFQGCSSLKKTEIPDSVARIGESSFIGCSNLADIHVPSSLTEIGNAAFYETDWGAKFEDPDLKYVGKVVYHQDDYDFDGSNRKRRRRSDRGGRYALAEIPCRV